MTTSPNRHCKSRMVARLGAVSSLGVFTATTVVSNLSCEDDAYHHRRWQWTPKPKTGSVVARRYTADLIRSPLTERDHHATSARHSTDLKSGTAAGGYTGRKHILDSTLLSSPPSPSPPSLPFPNELTLFYRHTRTSRINHHILFSTSSLVIKQSARLTHGKASLTIMHIHKFAATTARPE